MRKTLKTLRLVKMQRKLFRNLRKLLRTKKSDIIWLTYHQGQIFQKFKEKVFVSIVSRFIVSKSTIVFKIALVKLINTYPKIKNSSLSLHYFKKYLKTIREICKESASEFKWIIKICLNVPAFPLNDFIFKMWTGQFSIFQVH